MVWLKLSCVGRATLQLTASDSGRDVQYYTVVTAIGRSAIMTVCSSFGPLCALRSIRSRPSITPRHGCLSWQLGHAVLTVFNIIKTYEKIMISLYKKDGVRRGRVDERVDGKRVVGVNRGVDRRSPVLEVFLGGLNSSSHRTRAFVNGTPEG